MTRADPHLPSPTSARTGPTRPTARAAVGLALLGLLLAAPARGQVSLSDPELAVSLRPSEQATIPVTLTNDGDESVLLDSRPALAYTWISSADTAGLHRSLRFLLEFESYSDADVCASGIVYDPSAFTPDPNAGRGSNDGFIDVALPFDFPFYGERYQTVRIHTNGFLTFAPTQGASTTAHPRPIPAYPTPGKMIAPLWSDLDLEASSSPGRVCVWERFGNVHVRYENVLSNLTSGGPSTVDVFLRSDGTFGFQYVRLDPQLAEIRDSGDLVVGVEAPGSSTGIDLTADPSIELRDGLLTVFHPTDHGIVVRDAPDVWEDMSQETRLSPCRDGGTGVECYDTVRYPSELSRHGVSGTIYGDGRMENHAPFWSAATVDLIGGALAEGNLEPDLFFGIDALGRDVVQWGAGDAGVQLVIGQGGYEYRYGPAFAASEPAFVGFRRGLAPIALSLPGGSGLAAPQAGRRLVVSDPLPGVGLTGALEFLSPGESITLDVTLDAPEMYLGRITGALPFRLTDYGDLFAGRPLLPAGIVVDLSVTPCAEPRRTSEAWTLYDACTGGPTGLPGDDVTDVRIENGTLWVGTTNGLAKRTDEGWKTVTRADGLPHQTVTALGPSSEAYNRWIPVGTSAGPGTAGGYDAQPNAGSLQYGYSNNGGLFLISPLLQDPVTAIADLRSSGPSVYSILVGTEKGLFNIRENNVSLRYLERLGEGPVTDFELSPARDVLWVAREGVGVERWRNVGSFRFSLDTTFARPNTQPQLCLENAAALDVDADGILRVLYYDYGTGDEDYFSSGFELCSGSSTTRRAADDRRRRMARYDGKTWTGRTVRRSRRNARAKNGDLLTGVFTDIASSPDGIVWMSARPNEDGEGGGIAFTADADEAVWTVLDAGTSGLPSNDVRALAVDPENADLWIATAAGVVRYVPPLVAPSLSRPAADALATPLNPGLTWDRSPGATVYHVRVSSDPSFASPEVEAATSTTAYTLDDDALQPGTAYTWQVRYERGESVSDWSAPRQFTTGGRNWTHSARSTTHLVLDDGSLVGSRSLISSELPDPYDQATDAEAIAVEDDGTWWIGVAPFGIFQFEYDGAILRIPPGAAPEVVVEDVKSSAFLLAAAGDAAWGTADGTLYALSPVVSSLGTAPEAIVPDGAGGVWMRSDSQLTSTSGLPAPPTSPIRDVFDAQDNRLWLATDAGALLFDGAQWSRVGPSEGVLAVAERGGTAWLRVADGLVRGTSPYSSSDWTRFAYGDALPAGPFDAIQTDAEGNVWAVDAGDVVVFDGQEARRFAEADAAFRGAAESILAHENGAVWVLTDREVAATTAASSLGGGTAIGPTPDGGLELAPPHPNPARSAVTLRVHVPAPGPTVVAVYDALGREVARLLDDERAAGTHTVRWETAGVASGVYLVRLSQGEAHRVRRVTVLR